MCGDNLLIWLMNNNSDIWYSPIFILYMLLLKRYTYFFYICSASQTTRDNIIY